MDSNIDRPFRLIEIQERNIPGVSEGQVSSHIEACLVCLDHHKHVTGIPLTIVEEGSSRKVDLYWEETIDEQTRRSWKDLSDATEYGAIAIAILLVINCTEYTIIERSVKGTGFDYRLLEKDRYDEEDLFPEGTARLEVSGIMHAKTDAEILRRVREKKKQTELSDGSGLPALIIVTEFSRPETHMVKKNL